jgi:hypothetical protein
MAKPSRFTCFLCEEVFSRQGLFDAHLKGQHGQTPVWDQAPHRASSTASVSIWDHSSGVYLRRSPLFRFLVSIALLSMGGFLAVGLVGLQLVKPVSPADPSLLHDMSGPEMFADDCFVWCSSEFFT